MPLRRLIAHALARPWLLSLVLALLCTPPFAAAVNRLGRTPFGEPRHDIVRPNPLWHQNPPPFSVEATQPGRPLHWAKMFYDPAGKPLTTFEPTFRFPGIDPPGGCVALQPSLLAIEALRRATTGSASEPSL